MGSVNLSGIGLSGIAAAEAELQATEANITNADNPNYSVESVNLAAAPGPDGSSIGVDVLGVERAQAPFLNADIFNSQSSQSFSSAFSQVTQAAQSILEPSSGNDLGQSLQTLFNDFTNLAAQPEDATQRTVLLSDAGQFAATAGNLSTGLAQAASTGLGQLGTLIAKVNSDSNQIAQLNSQITATTASGGSAAALLDQRDGLASDLSNLIGATIDANGNVTVGGLPLVSGTTSLALSVNGPASAPVIGLTIGAEQVNVPGTSLGGQIGGLIEGAARVTQLQGSLDSLVTSVASAINAKQQAGFGLDGSTNVPLFLIPGASGNPIALNPAINTQNIAAASAAGVPGDGSNAAAIAALANTTGIDGSFPTSTAASAFAATSSNFGAAVQNAQNEQQQAGATLQSLTTLKGSITGVSLNDQLTDLVEFQNALQASARAVQVAIDNTQFLVTQLT